MVLYHVGLWWYGAFWFGFPALAATLPGPVDQALLWLMRLGFQGVSLFLVLSGFCLYYPLARAQGVRRACVALVPFARRRALRILPPYYASMAALVALARLPATASVVMVPITGLDLVTHAALVHNLLPSTIWTMNGAYWSLALEAQLYVVFPLLVAAGRRWGAGGLVLLGFGVSALWAGGLRAAGLGSVEGQLWGVLHEALPARLGEFTAGMAAAALLAERRRPPLRVLLPLALLWAPASHAVHVARLVELPLDRFANAVSFGALLLLAARLPERVLASAPLRLLAGVGAFSYSLYLVHQPLLLVLQKAAYDLLADRFLLLLAGLALSTALGWVFYRLTELPWLPAPRPRTTPEQKTLAHPGGLG